MLSFCLCVLCMFYPFIPFLSVLFVFDRKDLILLNLISRCMTSTNEYFWEAKTLLTLLNNLCISKLFIQSSTGSCCVYITGGANWNKCQSIGLFLPCMCFSVCVYDIKEQCCQKLCHLCQNKGTKTPTLGP